MSILQTVRASSSGFARVIDDLSLRVVYGGQAEGWGGVVAWRGCCTEVIRIRNKI